MVFLRLQRALAPLPAWQNSTPLALPPGLPQAAPDSRAPSPQLSPMPAKPNGAPAPHDLRAAHLVRDWFYFLPTVPATPRVAELVTDTRSVISTGTSHYHAVLRGILALHEARLADAKAAHPLWREAAQRLLEATRRSAESGKAYLAGYELSRALRDPQHDPARMPYARMLLGLTLSDLTRCPLSVQLSIYASDLWQASPYGLRYECLHAYWRTPDDAHDAASETATLAAINQLWAAEAIFEQIASVLQDAEAAPHMAAGCARWLADHAASSTDIATQRRVLAALLRCAEHHAPTWHAVARVCEQALYDDTAATALDTSPDTADFFAAYVTCLQHTQAWPFAAQPQLWQRLTTAGLAQLAATCEGDAAVFTMLLAHVAAQKGETPDQELRALCWRAFATLPAADQALHAKSLLREAPGSLPALICYVQSAQFSTCVADRKWLRKLSASYTLDALEALLLQQTAGPAAAVVLSLLETQPTLAEQDPGGLRRQLWAASWHALAPQWPEATTRAACMMESLIALPQVTQDARRATQFAAQFLSYTDDREAIARLYEALDPQLASAARDTVLCRLCALLMARKAYSMVQQLTESTALPAAARQARALALAHLADYDALWEQLRDAPPDDAADRQALIAILKELPAAGMLSPRRTRTVPTPLCAWLSLATLLARDAQEAAAVTVLLDAVPTTARQAAVEMPAGVPELAHRIYTALAPAEQALHALAVLQRFPHIIAAIAPYVRGMKSADACGSNRKWLKELGALHPPEQLAALLDGVDDAGAAYVLTMLEAHVPGAAATADEVQRADACGRRWLTLHDKGVFAPARSRAGDWLTSIAAPMLQHDDEAVRVNFATTFCASTDDVVVRYKTLGKYLATVEQIHIDTLQGFVCAKLLATRKEASYRSIVELTQRTAELSHEARRCRLFALIRLREHGPLAEEIAVLPAANEDAAYGKLWDALAAEIRAVSAPVSAKKSIALAHLNLRRHDPIAAMHEVIAAMQLPDADTGYLTILGGNIHRHLAFTQGLLAAEACAEITQQWLWVAPHDFAALQILLATGVALPEDLLRHVGTKQTSELMLTLHAMFSHETPWPVIRFHIAQIAEAVANKSQALHILLAREWAALAAHSRAGHTCIAHCVAALDHAEPPLHPDVRRELEQLIGQVCEAEDTLDTQIFHFYKSARVLSEANRNTLAAYIWLQRIAFCKQLMATQRYPEVIAHTRDYTAYATDRVHVDREREVVALRCQALMALSDYLAANKLAHSYDMYSELWTYVFDAVTKNPGSPATIPAPAAADIDWFRHVLYYLTHAQRAMVMAFDMMSRLPCGLAFWGRIEWIRFVLPDHVDEWLLPRLRRTLQINSEQTEKFVAGSAEYRIAECFVTLLEADHNDEACVAQQVDAIVAVFAENAPDSLFKTQPAEWVFGACIKSVQARHAECASITQLDPLLPRAFVADLPS